MMKNKTVFRTGYENRKASPSSEAARISSPSQVRGADQHAPRASSVSPTTSPRPPKGATASRRERGSPLPSFLADVCHLLLAECRIPRHRSSCTTPVAGRGGWDARVWDMARPPFSALLPCAAQGLCENFRRWGVGLGPGASG